MVNFSNKLLFVSLDCLAVWKKMYETAAKIIFPGQFWPLHTYSTYRCFCQTGRNFAPCRNIWQETFASLAVIYQSKEAQGFFRTAAATAVPALSVSFTTRKVSPPPPFSKESPEMFSRLLSCKALFPSLEAISDGGRLLSQIESLDVLT